MNMDKLKSMLKTHYRINSIDISPLEGGWAALAFEVKDCSKRYFLKVYEKSRASTLKWTASIHHYVPMLLWLHEHTRLTSHLPVPIITKSGAYQCEDEYGVYLLYAYIEGTTIGEQALSEEQVIQLAVIIADLHTHVVTEHLSAKEIIEDFQVPFLIALKETIELNIQTLPFDLSAIISPRLNQIMTMINKLQSLAESLKHEDLKMVWCHTDIHHWNLMQAGEQLMLIDWEGLRLAPVEADMMFLMNEPYYETFLRVYRSVHKGYALHADALRFYQYRRKLEDIWEFIEQLLYDHQLEEERVTTLSALGNELDELSSMLD
ncbi:Ser/Thr protein kinase RdoA involved in Cpx stress response, MazF antagonist [Paenibacillus aquistagni]|uniref:Ser/Thr protein kinase RdoA involved in Cpx stress response, MazF antagonist n=2 Tax=Paenibacillus aquistagni TaxID=1852522 RepID=A0A1X7J3Y1_9BACL|nr:Ser/Thr protein kinase RdoA involved in Cpx stress response, MazF antagonist [Paenibacillus aquistagni]